MTENSTYRFFNPNPVGSVRKRDCVIRAICAVFNIPWDDAFDMLAERAKQMGTTMDENAVYGSLLRQYGFNMATVPSYCHDCLTGKEFCEDNPTGIYVLGFDGHVATVINGQIWDTFDSGDEIVMYYWFLPAEGDK